MKLDLVEALMSSWDWSRPGGELLDAVEEIVNETMPLGGVS